MCSLLNVLIPRATDPAVFSASIDGGEAPGPPSSAIVTADTILAGFEMGRYDPWSPTQPWLALTSSDGLSIFDATTPGVAPYLVYERSVTAYSWSPDGRWLVLRVSAGGLAAFGSLVVVRASRGAPPFVIKSNLDVGDFVWGSDGNIYSWGNSGPTRRQFVPPPEWLNENPGPFTARLIAVQVYGLRTQMPMTNGRPVFCRFSPHLSPPEVMLTPLLSASLLAMDGFPDGSRLLVQSWVPDKSGVTLVVDSEGTPLAQLGTSNGPMKFNGTSVSADGTFVAGEQTEDDGHSTLSSRLLIFAASNDWHLFINNVPDGMDPRLSRVGSFISYVDLERTLHVGSLQLD
jgi:hypothetical protein